MPAAVTGSLPRIVERHAEDAAFLWTLRDAAVDAPHFNRFSLARLEQRIEAHLQGLVVAGELGVELAQAQLDRFAQAGELFTVAALALAAGDRLRLEHALEVARAVPASRRGLPGAIGWAAPSVLAPTVRDWLAADDPHERLLGIVACSHHRVDPGHRLSRLLDDPDAAVASRARRLAGELGRVDLREALAGSSGDDPWGPWSAALLGDPAAARLTMGHGPAHRPSLDAALRLLPPPEAVAGIRRLHDDPARRRTVIEALGALGDPAALPWLLGRMTEPDAARLAGASFALVTGVDLVAMGLDAPAHDDLERGPNDDPDDERVAPDPDEPLPWPDAAKVALWWEKAAGGFAGGVRHLLGHVVGEASARRALADGNQWQRRAAAYELAALRPGLPSWRGRIVRDGG